MKARAAVAWEAKKPLTIEEIEVMGPKAGEVLLQTVASGVCHTDAFTLSGDDPEGSFPCVLGHEGGCIVVELGAGVKNLKVVIMLSRFIFLSVVNVSFVNQVKLTSASLLRARFGQVICQMARADFQKKVKIFIIIWVVLPFLNTQLCLKLHLLKLIRKPR